MPIASAASQSSGLRSLETNAATKIKTAPGKAVQTSLVTADRKSGSSRAARAKSAGA